MCKRLAARKSNAARRRHHPKSTDGARRKLHSSRASRSDIATTKRAVQDLKDQTQKLSNAILQIAATSPDCAKEAFEAAWQQRQQLNSVQQQLTSLEQQLSNCLPHASTARLTDKERKEIQGLYSSGLYTQGQLADQYG
jgi:hypothetical protein